MKPKSSPSLVIVRFNFTLAWYIHSFEHPNLIKIGKRIRAIREERGYSQEEFAAAAQLGRSYAGRVERGEQNISMQSLIQIALTLEIEVGQLFPPLRELKTPNRKRIEK